MWLGARCHRTTLSEPLASYRDFGAALRYLLRRHVRRLGPGRGLT